MKIFAKDLTFYQSGEISPILVQLVMAQLAEQSLPTPENPVQMRVDEVEFEIM